MLFCKECGKKLKENQLFCNGCGRQTAHSPTPKSQEIEQKTRYQKPASSSLNFKIVLICSIFIIGAFFAGKYFMGAKPEAEKAASPPSQVQAEKTEPEETQPPDEPPPPPVEKEEEEPTDTDTQTTITADIQSEEEETYEATAATTAVNSAHPADDLTDAITKLNEIKIPTSSRDISLTWQGHSEEDGLGFMAVDIPAEDLQGLFDLYDQGKIDVLKTWAKKVYEIVDDAGTRSGKEWSVYVGDQCVGAHPKTLPSEDLMNFSGSCGYSIPVLGGFNKANYTLILNERVFGANEEKDIILPDSSRYPLAEADIPFADDKARLRLARNEIFARHGYMFKSADLQEYFSTKAWYSPDPAFDGTLSDVEKHNVALIKRLEER
ncbi:YARHG domain-containing protein [Bacillus salacetis]|uniref:YARHG domain-containing protein n=1 Tax=Bacillus salacetis TaxID=2315464 RepID=UPI003B9F3846